MQCTVFEFLLSVAYKRNLSNKAEFVLYSVVLNFKQTGCFSSLIYYIYLP